MTGQEIREWLDQRPFQPFRVTMNNGETYDVWHPEVVLIAETDALYIFEPSQEEAAHVRGLPTTSVAIRNICTVEPLPLQTA